MYLLFNIFYRWKLTGIVDLPFRIFVARPGFQMHPAKLHLEKVDDLMILYYRLS